MNHGPDDDQRHFARIVECVELSIAQVSARLDQARRAPGGIGQEAMDRDMDVHRLAARLRTLRRYGPDLCLGRIVAGIDAEPTYIGRLGLIDHQGRRLLHDWRTAAAEPFFAATHAHPMGLISRRRYRWTAGLLTDYWDEVFAPTAATEDLRPDDQSAFIASLGADRSSRMRDVLGTIQADQHAIIRAGSRGALVVEGGPGTGKTVVALHRTAYLLHADPRLGARRGGVLFVGPSRPYLAYVSDVLPSLGEEGVRTCTLRDLVPEGAEALAEADQHVAALKASGRLVGLIEPAVALYEEPPRSGMVATTDWSEVWVSVDDWAEAFAAPDPGTPHNEARDQVWDELLTILADKHQGDDVDPVALRRSLSRDHELRETFHRAWPVIEPADLVADLWSVPAYLRRCGPWLSPDDVRRLQRDEPYAWTEADLPLLDAARQRLGDPDGPRRRLRRDAVVAAERRQLDRVIDELAQADGDAYGVGLVTSLRHADLQEALVDDASAPTWPEDELAGPFGHIVIDEAQELTDAQWQMLLSRCPSRSFTIVGDRAQAREGFAESWSERLARVGVEAVSVASLSVNYRTPVEIMAEAEPIIRAALPDANVPTSIRSTGVAVRHGTVDELRGIVEAWLVENAEGAACVIGAGATELISDPRLRWLTPQESKGLEFDLVVVVGPETFGGGIRGAVDRYVAMTRSTRQLVLLTGPRTALSR